jgi:hypothetical protein
MGARSADRSPSLRVLVAVGLVAGCALALQVLLTRLFAAVLFYHFAFLAISLALLGTGAAAILIYIRPGWFARRPVRGTLAEWSVALGVLLLVVPALLVRLDYPFEAHVDAGFVVKLAVACALSTVPFFAIGVVISLAIRHYVSTVARVYAFDLVGAGLGALVVVPLMWLVDVPTLIVLLGSVASLAAILFGERGHPIRSVGSALAAAGVGLAVLSAVSSLYYLPPTQQRGDERPEVDRWTPLSRVVASRFSPRLASLHYDRDGAPVIRFRRGTPHPGWRALDLGPQSIGYALTGPGRSLVIGGGGGRDIHNALASGQRRVDVIELNRAIRSAVDDDLGRFSGSPYSLPRVRTVVGDGRSTLAAQSTKYDQVHIGFTNTLSPGAGSSFVLAENNLYTVEAFEEYLDHLRPGGILNVTRLYRLAGDEALRATVLTLAALERRGIDDPRRHVVVVLSKFASAISSFGTVLARLEPFNDGELRRIRRLARERGGGVAFAPGGPYQLEWRRLAASRSVDDFCHGYQVDVCAPTDDKPFFLNVTRLSDIGGTTLDYLVSPNPYVVLLIVLGILAVLSVLAFVLPLALVRDAGRPEWSSLLFFAAIGLGFLILEVVLIQRFVLFLGFPTYALSVVLFSLLLFTGAGSFLAGQRRDPKRALTIALALAAVLIAAASVGLQPLLRSLIDLPFAARVVVAVALLAPFGLTLGMAMPIGLQRLSALYPRGVPWAWGVNGVTSVMAAVLALAVAITWGFTATTALSLVCYLGALAHVILGRWPPTAIGTDNRPLAASTAEVRERQVVRS